MKVLWLTVDRSMRVAHHYDNFQSEVGKLIDVDFVRPRFEGKSPPQVVKAVKAGTIKLKKYIEPHSVNSVYDAVITDSLYLFTHEDWAALKIPRISIVEETHGNLFEMQMSTTERFNFEFVAYRYRDGFLNKYGNISSEKIWLPHAVNADVYKDYGEEKTIGVLQVGILHPFYPVRQQINKKLKDKYYYKRIERPRDDFRKTKKWPVRDEYSKLLNSAKIAVTCGAKVKYPVLKYFEIPASGTLLLADWIPELSDLGFVDGQNMISIDMKNLVFQVEELLANQIKIDSIQKAGTKLILENHTMNIRASQFVKEISK